MNPFHALTLILRKVFHMSLQLDALKQAEADAEARILKAVDAISGAEQAKADLAAAQAALAQAQTDAAAAAAAAAADLAASQTIIDDLTAKLVAATAKLPA